MFIVGRVKEKNLIKNTSQLCLDFLKDSKDICLVCNTWVKQGFI